MRIIGDLLLRAKSVLFELFVYLRAFIREMKFREAIFYPKYVDSPKNVNLPKFVYDKKSTKNLNRTFSHPRKSG